MDKFKNVVLDNKGRNSKAESDINHKSVLDSINDRRRRDNSENIMEDSHKRATFLFDRALENKLNTLSNNLKKRIINTDDHLLSKGFKTRFINEAINQLLDKYEDENGLISETLKYARFDNYEVILSDNQNLKRYDLILKDYKRNKIIKENSFKYSEGNDVMRKATTSYNDLCKELIDNGSERLYKKSKEDNVPRISLNKRVSELEKKLKH